MRRLFILLIVMTLGIGRADVPKLFREKAFTCDTLADAANHFVGIGEDAAVKEMKDISEMEAADAEKNHGFDTRGFSVNERIGWVCRILFEPKSGSKKLPYLRPPKFGKLGIPEKYMPIERWPLYPVVLSGSSYFVIGEIYTEDNATPEELKHYLTYCVQNGDFRATPVKVPAAAEVLQDIDALHKSDPWQAIQWVDESGYSYPMGEQWTWDYIQKQAKIPAKVPAKPKPPVKVPAKVPAN